MVGLVFVLGYATLKPSLARVEVGSGEFVVKEQFHIRCFLEFVKESVVQGCPVDRVDSLICQHEG